MTQIAAGFLFGMAGSVHCLAMCGPLAWMSGGRSSAAAAYHASRVAVYVVLGAIAGAAGGAVAASGWARALAVAAGVVLIAQSLQVLAPVTRFPRVLVSWLLRESWRPAGPCTTAAILGAANGLMPCGLLYAALITAAGMGDVVAAMGFVAGFGLGSLPIFAALAMSGALVRSRAPRMLRRAMPIALALAGVLLIARAWSLPPDPAIAPYAHSSHTHLAP
jgi:sulfite exporter TauE/SafE